MPKAESGAVVGLRLLFALISLLLWVGAVDRTAAAELPRVRLETIVSGIPAPVDLVALPDDSGRFFVADQSGILFLLTADGVLHEFLDLRAEIGTLYPNWEEGGLLGIALHPDFETNGSIYVNHSVPGPTGYNRTMRVVEYRMPSADSLHVDPTYRHIIMESHQRQNHYGGGIGFGPDGYLYVALGDGGGHHDPYKNGQNPHTRQGTIMRIAVTPGQPGFTVPRDNPFVGSDDGLDEIWAWGLRNPYRFSFDPVTRHLFVGHVGQELWESIVIATNPANFGWSVKEGAHWFPGNGAPIIITEGPAMDAFGDPFVPPIVEYGNTRFIQGGGGTAVVGVHLYRGEAFPELYGSLIFGDFRRSGLGRMYIAHPPEGWSQAWAEGPVYDAELWEWEYWFGINEILRSVAVDHEGELYLLVSRRADTLGETGIIYKVHRDD